MGELEEKAGTPAAAFMAYMASEDDRKTSREKIDLPKDAKTGKPGTWPVKRIPTLKGGLD